MEKYWASCPDCGKDIDYESFNYDDHQEDTVYFYGIGTCLHCNKKWKWEERFKLTEICLFENITDMEMRKD